ncbi:nucleophile aminohydrolase [Microdochium trichocladiopsis]|uniref:Nucleophile aminohydrolase n=1 Tax=Microdochium trichocladiopsis TaxID=1682393 RepID=A0A9P8Y1G5_9PEZI|nr:nucleophile aminohydrolase [Microdochium trichocladiopsis]KAH7028168.1 nucleophile aminohydrolase [Microdochium trichocladiopsis]
MEYKQQHHAKVTPRLIIHGGAGNIAASMSPEKYNGYKEALLTIIAKTNKYMNTPKPKTSGSTSESGKLPSALDVATFAMVQLENNPLFNSGHGAVFTRDGINELEASLMVTRGHAKRAVGVTGLKHVKNPILLAREMLERGEDDLWGKTDLGWAASDAARVTMENEKAGQPEAEEELNIPSAQGHTLIHGPSAEQLARKYGLELVGPEYFFTQNRWDEHVRALEREKEHKQKQGTAAAAASDASQPAVSATWSPDEYLPQGTCGAVAMDETGTICVATSTGGMTNKLTGRIGDTPSVGAGFWAEEWEDSYNPDDDASAYASSAPTPATALLPSSPADWSLNTLRQALSRPSGITELSSSLRGVLADCLPGIAAGPSSSQRYSPIPLLRADSKHRLAPTTGPAIRATALSGTGNGDSFLRINAVRTVASIARWGKLPTRLALAQVAAPGGELQRSAQDRWGKTGEGEGGMIGIECVIVGRVVKSEIVHDHNSTGMFRAWIDDEGKGNFQIWRDKGPDTLDLDHW